MSIWKMDHSNSFVPSGQNMATDWKKLLTIIVKVLI